MFRENCQVNVSGHSQFNVSTRWDPILDLHKLRLVSPPLPTTHTYTRSSIILLVYLLAECQWECSSGDLLVIEVYIVCTNDRCIRCLLYGIKQKMYTHFNTVDVCVRTKHSCMWWWMYISLKFLSGYSSRIFRGLTISLILGLIYLYNLFWVRSRVFLQR